MIRRKRRSLQDSGHLGEEGEELKRGGTDFKRSKKGIDSSPQLRTCRRGQGCSESYRLKGRLRTVLPGNSVSHRGHRRTGGAHLTREKGKPQHEVRSSEGASKGARASSN